ncbi:MAG: hypothetical protein ISEC1_P0142 [Thiomicrorhabdus sp.]|nr:MAG: hypothetical protein ISEC1_P0142 [Thiomicrorhabdus sp.]
MSNIVDDLLQEVEQLESSTQELNESVQKVAEQKKVLSDSDASTSVDANLLALEAAKTTQEAATQSHLAAKSSIKLADQLKVRTIELDDLSNNLRQTTRNTLKNVNSAKNNFTLMITTTLVINIVALSVIGYFFYANNQQATQANEEVLDVIQTESILLSKKITRKMDELTNMTEALGGNVQRLSQSNENQSTTKPDMSNAEPKVMHQDKSVAEQNDQAKQANQLATQYAELKGLIESIATTQKQAEHQPTRKATGEMHLDPALMKQLRGLSWLVRQQGNNLKAIQKSLGSGTAAGQSKPLEALKTELQTLNKHQSEIKAQLNQLQSDFNKFAIKPKAKPYSYNSANCHNRDSCAKSE